MTEDELNVNETRFVNKLIAMLLIKETGMYEDFFLNFCTKREK